MPRLAPVESVEVDLTIRVKANQFGHKVPIETGVSVTFDEIFSGRKKGIGLRAPGYDTDPSTGLPTLVDLPLNGVGIVMAHDWFVDDYVNNVTIERGRLKGAYQMYYLVMWADGMLWSRYDWILEVSEKETRDRAAQVEGLRKLQSGAGCATKSEDITEDFKFAMNMLEDLRRG